MALYNSCARISFSFDLIDDPQHPPPPPPTMLENSYREAPVSSNFDIFELSGPNNDITMISADEIFFNGRMVPLKETRAKKGTTIRDELLVGEEEHGDTTQVGSDNKGWKQHFGLKRLHRRVVPKKDRKSANIVGGLGSIDEMAC